MISSSRQWQHPFVDVFKTFATDARSSSLPGSLVAEVRGDVSEEMDREICKRVFRIQGPVCANNYIQVPSRKVKCMGLTGEYIYLLVKPLEKNFFLIHLDFVVSSGNRFRISLSNIYQEGKSTYHCINCPCKLPEAWTVVRVHVPPVLELGSHAAPHGYLLRSLQLCASLMVRGVFTSDRFYSQEDAPRELVGGAVWQWLDMPELAVPQPEAQRPLAELSPATSQPTRETTEERWPRPAASLRHLRGSRTQKASRFAVLTNGAEDHGPAKTEAKVVSVASMALSMADLEDAGAEVACKHFFAHTMPIQLLEASDDGRWVASVQAGEGKKSPLLRLWRCGPPKGLDCTTTLPLTALSSVQSVAFDGAAQHLAVSGQDNRARQNLIVWDMSRAQGGAINLIAQQTGAETTCLRFSPFEELALVSCGPENIRFWKVKDKHIPGCFVPLGATGRQTNFTCLGFECRKMGHTNFLSPAAAEKVRVFVATGDGRVVQVNYKSRKVLAVHQLHNEAITWICSNDVFCVTAAADKLVRVWPLDFNSFYLHSSHDSPVVGIDVSSDGGKVLCSSADGSVGVLDVRTHQYQDIFRSHQGSIIQAAISDVFKELATISSGAVKVWKLPCLQQAHEFPVEDLPQVIDFHPCRHLLAVGFQSGAVRIYDVDTPALLRELRPTALPVLSLGFAESEGEVTLAVCDGGGGVAQFDEAFEQICAAQCPAGSGKPLVNSSPARLLWPGSRSAALLSLSGRSVAVLSIEGKVSSASFSLHGRYAVLCADSKRAHVFEAEDGAQVFSVSWGSMACHMLLADPSLVSPGMLLMSSADRLLRLGRVSPGKSELELEQTFAAHATVPHQLLVAGGRCISISSSEMACWDLTPEVAKLLEPVVQAESSPVPAALEAAAEWAQIQAEETPAVPEGLLEAAMPEPATAPQPAAAEPKLAEPDEPSGPAEPAPSALPEPAVLPEPAGMKPDSTATSEAEDVIEEGRDADGRLEAREMIPVPHQPVARRKGRGKGRHDHKEVSGEAEARWSLELAGVQGCHVTTSQSIACQLPFRLCFLLGKEVALEDYTDDSSQPKRSLLPSPASPAEEEEWEAIAVDMDPGGRGVGALFMSPARMCLRRFADEQMEQLELPHYGAKAALRLMGGQMAITAGSCEGGSRVDVWRFGAGASIGVGAGASRGPWATAGLTAEVLGLELLRGNEFAVLTRAGLTFWRCDDECDLDTAAGFEDLDATCARLQFQSAEAPAEWDLSAEFVAIATGVAESEEPCQLVFVASAEGALWIHDADDNVPLSLLPLSVSGRVTCLSSHGPILALGAGPALYTLTPAGAGAAARSPAVLDLDGDVRALRLLNAESGVVATAANTIWYFQLDQDCLVPLQSFPPAPQHMAAGVVEGVGALCTISGDGLRLWQAKGHEALEVARLPITPQPGNAHADEPCVALHVAEDAVFCGFLDGTVLVFDLHTCNLASRTSVPLRPGSEKNRCCGCCEREGLLAMEPVTSGDTTHFLLGTSFGRILQAKVGLNKVLSLEPSCFSTSSVSSIGSMSRQVQSCTCTTGIFTASWSGEVSIWTRDTSQSLQMRFNSWRQRLAKLPPLPAPPRCKCALCREVLESPPMVACFLPPKLLAVTQRNSSKLILYSCQDGSIRFQVDLEPALLPVQRLIAPGCVGAALCVCARNRLAVARVGETVDVEEAGPLPGSSSAGEGSRPSICLSGTSVWVQTQAALSRWELRAGPAG